MDVANKKAANTVFQRKGIWLPCYLRHLQSHLVLVLIGRFDPSDTALRNPKVQPNVSTAFLCYKNLKSLDCIPHQVNLDERSKLIVKAKGQIPTASAPEFVLLQGEFQGSQSTAVKIELAQLQIDDAGRLVFVPGKGEARSVANPSKPQPPVISDFNSADWIDDICDGSVSVTVKKDGNV